LFAAALLASSLAWAGEVPVGGAFEFYEEGLRRGRAGVYAGAAGLAVGGGGAIGVVVAGCKADPEGTCTGNWLPDGIAFAGTLTGIIGSGAIAGGSLRARRGLHALGIDVSPGPAIASWVLVFGALGGMAAWIEFARPTEALPKLIAVRDPLWLGVDLGAVALAYGMGIWQYALVTSKRSDAKAVRPPEDEEDALRIDLVPWFGADRYGLAAAGRF
jgi:hypothetical protein